MIRYCRIVTNPPENLDPPGFWMPPRIVWIAPRIWLDPPECERYFQEYYWILQDMIGVFPRIWLDTPGYDWSSRIWLDPPGYVFSRIKDNRPCPRMMIGFRILDTFRIFVVSVRNSRELIGTQSPQVRLTSVPGILKRRTMEWYAIYQARFMEIN